MNPVKEVTINSKVFYQVVVSLILMIVDTTDMIRSSNYGRQQQSDESSEYWNFNATSNCGDEGVRKLNSIEINQIRYRVNINYSRVQIR